MQLPSSHNPHTPKLRGFTLVEMLVIVPVALLTIAALISLMVALVGDVMMARSRAVAVYELQETLDRIEQDSRISTAFLPSFSQLPSPQGRDGNTGAFSAAGPNFDVILNMPATTENPFSGTRNLVYYADQPNPCSGTYQGNRPLTTRVVYFTTDNGNGTKTLWRRTIVPDWTTTGGSTSSVCNAPWQRDSCPVGSAMSSTCQTIDEKMLSSVTAFTPTYYDANGASTTDVRNAVSMSIGLNQSQQIAGETISSSSSARITHVNGTTDQVPTTAPTVTIDNPDINTMNNPTLTSFTWNSVPNAAYYSLRYKIGAGAWVYPADQTGTTFQITTARPLDVISFEVTPKNDMGAGTIGALNYTKPLWTVANLTNGWACYQPGTWPCPSYTLSSAGVVLLQGLAKDGPTGASMFTLPASVTPNKQIIFTSNSSGSSHTRIDVAQGGDVVVNNGSNNSWVSIDSIRFLSQSVVNPSWLAPSYGGTWTAYGGTWGSPQYVKDSLGRVHVYGLIKGGANLTAGTTLLGFNSGHQPSGYEIWTTTTYPDETASYQITTLNTATARGQGSPSLFAIAAMYHPASSTTTFNNLAFTGGWVNYGAEYSTAAYGKASDGIVSLRGLIKSGTGAVIATLPAGYCPATRNLFSTQGTTGTASYSQQSIARIDIWWDGAANNCKVELVSTTPAVMNGWLSLNGIHFIQER